MIIQKRTYSKHIKKMGYATIFRTQCTFTLIAVKRSNASLPMSKGWSAGTRVSAVWGLSSLKYCWYLLHSSLWKHKQTNKQRVMTGNRNSVQPIQNCTAIFTVIKNTWQQCKSQNNVLDYQTQFNSNVKWVLIIKYSMYCNGTTKVITKQVPAV